MTASTGLQCVQCRYDLSGALVGGRCPECGTEIMTSLRAGTLPMSGKAVAALVLGICSITLGCASYGILSIIMSPLAIIFAAQARRDARQGRVNNSSRGLATAGLITAIIGILPALLGLVILGFFVIALITEASGM